MRSAFVLLAFACRIAHAEPAQVAVKLSPLYAPLFKEGAVWKYRIVHTREWDEDAARDAGRVDSKGKVDRNERFPYEATCSASKLTRFKIGLAIQVACTYDKKRMEALVGPKLIGPPIDAIYLATARGLYQHGAYPKDDKDYGDAVRGRPMIPFRPARWAFRKKSGDRLIEKSLKSKQLTVLGRPRKVWCAYEYELEGDGCDSTFCFADGIGIVSSQARSIAALMDSSDAEILKGP